MGFGAALVWHALASFTHTGTWQDIATVLLTLVLLGALLLLACVW